MCSSLRHGVLDEFTICPQAYGAVKSNIFFFFESRMFGHWRQSHTSREMNFLYFFFCLMIYDWRDL